jgi:hypothetical protein
MYRIGEHPTRDAHTIIRIEHRYEIQDALIDAFGELIRSYAGVAKACQELVEEVSNDARTFVWESPYLAATVFLGPLTEAA